MRICIVYDCLYPLTVGGAERWYRNLALRLAEDGHEVTYLTMQQWDAAEAPDFAGGRVVSVAPRMHLYAQGRRRILPPLVFGLGVLRHLLKNGSRYDIVHTASFPFFSLLAAAICQRRAGYRLMVDWHELWTRDYWREYLGRVGSWFGWRVQRLCLRIPQRAFCFSRLVEERLLAEGIRGEVTLLEGQFEGRSAVTPLPAEALVVFAGRHIAEKDPVAVVLAVAQARETIPELHAVIYGDGPERPKVLAAIAEHALQGVVEAPGFVEGSMLEDALACALCLVLPSRREGYGLIVLEALSKGTPAILVQGDDNAATEFIEDGVNGLVARDSTPSELAAAIARIRAGGAALRASTLARSHRDAERRSLRRSLDLLSVSYRG